MGRKANRLGATLLQRREGEHDYARTLAIRGRFGSGKTSLTYLIERGAPTDRKAVRLIFARTNCWGFEDAPRAQEHILRSCVERLNDFVDTTALRSLPRHYIEAIGETPFKSVGILLGQAKEPIDLLKQFSPVLEAINARLVVVIEDLDRAGPDFDQTQIFALLHRLRHVERVSFILTTGGRTPIELHKVTEHVEFLDDLDGDRATEIIQLVRAKLRAKDFVDPQTLVEQHYPQKRRLEDLRTDGQLYWPPHVATLLSNLRTLKFALRDYRARWEELRGEVDLDELLMLLALRHGAPPAYEFLMSNSRDLFFLRQFRFGDHGREDHQRHVAPLKEHWETIVAGNSFPVEAAASVLHELFPGIGPIVGEHGRPWGIRVQSVRGDREQIYLNRIHTAELAPDAVRDQVVISRLRDAAAAATGMDRLVEGIQRIDGFAELVRFFQKELRLLTEAQQFQIVARLLDGARRELGARATIRGPELHDMEEWIERRGGEIDTQRDWFIAQLHASVGVSMTLTSQLLSQAFENPSQEQMNGESIVRALCEHIATMSAEEFIATLDPETPHALQWLFNAWRPSHAAHWRAVVEKLIESMQVNPTAVLFPSALVFVSQRSPAPAQADLIVGDRVGAVLGDQARAYYAMIANSSTPTGIMTNQWVQFQSAARLLLQALPSHSQTASDQRVQA